MVVFVDLEDEEDVNDPHTHVGDFTPYHILKSRQEHASAKGDDEDRPNPNINGFSAAMGCYPIISQIASFLDLNTLHELSRTCRQVRANLLQYRTQLIAHTLRCENEDVGMGLKLGDRLRESHHAWNTYGAGGVRIGRITSGKVGACARDMVGSADGVGASCAVPKTFTYTAFARSPCTCADNVWICQPCGQSLRTDDVTYLRGWTWRTRYSTYLGGLGTGIGEGNEGVQCGRLHDCLAAKEVEKEIDCDAAELAALRAEAERAELEGRSWGGTSYLMQEMEGIGGVVKKKSRRESRWVRR
ncbi:hypothetical protein H2203_008072 [Taxawa tesnikishii (nom. ined.)]|nr:hypothetical protein H2203_008072 [Dothideales sp. JES 119]